MISFILAVRNEEKALPRTLESLTGYKGPHEIIVADDHSADGTVAAARRYTDKVVENTGERFTIAANRNAGAALAQGDIFVFADADSYVRDADDFFEKVEAMFRDDSRLGAVTFFNRFTPDLETRKDRLFLAYFNNVAWLINLAGFGTCTGRIQAMRADTFRKLNGYNPAIVASEDVELFRRMAKAGKTRSARSLTVYHSGRRQHALGWARVIWIWTVNSAAALFFKKAYSKEWQEVR